MTETEKALAFIQYFKTTTEWFTMVNTVEDSPWHREANVGVHTEMSIQQYLDRFAAIRTDYQNKLALLSLLFHDTGKPAAEEVVHSEARGTYRRYAGHEQDSAVTFTEFFLKDPSLQEIITSEDARKIRWIIEHHLPFGYKDKAKRQALRTAIAHTLREDEETFFDHVRCDAAGRISDDHARKLQDVDDWFDEFKKIELQANVIDVAKGCAYILIGPSGSGKSTWTKERIRACDKVVSMDVYRLEFYEAKGCMDYTRSDKETYAAAFTYCTDNAAEFTKYMNERVKSAFHDLDITHGSVFIDNVNSSKKSRARWIQEARNIGMKVVAVEFWNQFNTVLRRQKSRPDKDVPYGALKSQYFAQTCGWLGSEVDEVIVVVGS